MNTPYSDFEPTTADLEAYKLCLQVAENERELKALETRVYRHVCDVRSYLTKAEIDRLYELRQICGKKYDAACGVWRPLDAE